MTQPAALPADEAARIARLEGLAVLDTPREVLFDALAKAAAKICGSPISLISLVDRDRQWFKANVGLREASETSREIAFCAHAILEKNVMEVNDARSDSRFERNPLVLGEPHIRFYAGAPIRMSDGLSLGTLCVIDRIPRALTANQRDSLQHLADAVASALEYRNRAHRAIDALLECRAQNESLLGEERRPRGARKLQ